MTFAMRGLTRLTQCLRSASAVSVPRTSIRAYSTPASPKGKSNAGVSAIVAALIASAATGAFVMQNDIKDFINGKTSGTKVPTKEDYQQVYNEVAKNLENESYDDGSYAPVVLRLSWHSSGTYDKNEHNGGSNGATMRFKPEASHGANAGLENARKFHEPIKAKFPWISYSDLWTLGGVAAVQEMGGPKVLWRPGRQDKPVEATPPEGRLPGGPEDRDQLRKIFYRLGFNDQEIVALAGAHAVGRCHTHHSGYDGPWTFSPTSFTNQYFVMLLEQDWIPKEWDGPFQYVDKESKSLMMLPADYLLVKDGAFNKYVKQYAKDEERFFKDFASAYSRLMELGVPKENFEEAAKKLGIDGPLTFKTLDEQE